MNVTNFFSNTKRTLLISFLRRRQRRKILAIIYKKIYKNVIFNKERPTKSVAKLIISKLIPLIWKMCKKIHLQIRKSLIRRIQKSLISHGGPLMLVKAIFLKSIRKQSGKKKILIMSQARKLTRPAPQTTILSNFLKKTL